MSHVAHSAYHATQDARVGGHAAIERGRAALRHWDAYYSRSDTLSFGMYRGARDAMLYALASLDESLILGAPLDVERAVAGVEHQIQRLDALTRPTAKTAPKVADGTETPAPGACGAICKCVARGACSRLTTDEVERGCLRPGFAGGSFIVWGHNGAPYPGRPEPRCLCGKH